MVVWVVVSGGSVGHLADELLALPAGAGQHGARHRLVGGDHLRQALRVAGGVVRWVKVGVAC